MTFEQLCPLITVLSVCNSDYQAGFPSSGKVMENKGNSSGKTGNFVEG